MGLRILAFAVRKELMLKVSKTNIIIPNGTGKSIKDDNMLCYNITLASF